MENQKKEAVSDNNDQLEHTKTGLQSCIDHTARLLKDSKLLIKKKRYSASIPLSILAIEETGKAHVMQESLSLGKPLSDKIWKDMTRGGNAHVKKVTSLILSRKLHLDNTTPEEDNRFNEIMKDVGIPVVEKNMAQIDNAIMRGLFLRLERIKQDCFYTDLDTNKNWINFDSRFNDEIKEAITTYIYVTALRMHTVQKFARSIPQKSFDKYSVTENKTFKSRWKKEVNNVFKKTDTKKIGHLTDIAIITINNTYSPDERGLIKDGSILDF